MTIKLGFYGELWADVWSDPGPALAGAGRNARPRRRSLWAVVLWRHRVQSIVLYDHGRAHI